MGALRLTTSLSGASQINKINKDRILDQLSAAFK